MQTTKQALTNSFEYVVTDYNGVEHVYKGDKIRLLELIEDELPKNGYWRFKFGDKNEYELCLENLFFDEQMYLSLYKDKDSLIDKVVVKPGYIEKSEVPQEKMGLARRKTA